MTSNRSSFDLSQIKSSAPENVQEEEEGEVDVSLTEDDDDDMFAYWPFLVSSLEAEGVSTESGKGRSGLSTRSLIRQLQGKLSKIGSEVVRLFGIPWEDIKNLTADRYAGSQFGSIRKGEYEGMPVVVKEYLVEIPGGLFLLDYPIVELERLLQIQHESFLRIYGYSVALRDFPSFRGLVFRIVMESMAKSLHLFTRVYSEESRKESISQPLSQTMSEEDKTLDDTYARSLSIFQKFGLLRQCAQALKMLHSRGWVHLDVRAKPELEDFTVKVKIGRFANLVRKGGRRMFAQRSKFWCAPEAFQPGQADETIDIYSFGSLIFEVLHGVDPFQSQYEPKKLKWSDLEAMVCGGERPVLVKLRDSCPEFADFVGKLWTRPVLPEYDSMEKVLRWFDENQIFFRKSYSHVRFHDEDVSGREYLTVSGVLSHWIEGTSLLSLPEELRMRWNDVKKVSLPFARGGFAAVSTGIYEGISVAVKDILLKNQAYYSMAAEEFNYLVKFRHRHVVRCYGFAVKDHPVSPYFRIVMERMTTDLNSYVSHLASPPRDAPIVEFESWLRSTSLTLYQKCAQVLAFLHSNGTLHRDVKASNFLIGGTIDPQEQSFNPIVKICDFGLAKVKRSQAIQSLMTAKRGTLAPEIIGIRGIAEYGFSADIFSLAVTFYEILYGCVPFSARDDPSEGEVHRTNYPAFVLGGGRPCLKKIRNWSPLFGDLIEGMWTRPCLEQYDSMEKVVGWFRSNEEVIIHEYASVRFNDSVPFYPDDAGLEDSLPDCPILSEDL